MIALLEDDDGAPYPDEIQRHFRARMEDHVITQRAEIDTLQALRGYCKAHMAAPGDTCCPGRTHLSRACMVRRLLA